MYLTVEGKLKGDYEKWNSNNGFVKKSGDMQNKVVQDLRYVVRYSSIIFVACDITCSIPVLHIIRLLEIFSLPGIKNLNYYYKIRSKKNFEKIKFINKENQKTQLEYFPIIAGVNFLDQVRSL